MNKKKAVQIRCAVESDAEGVGRVHVDSWRTTYAGIVAPEFLASLSVDQRVEAARRRISNPDIDKFVAVDGNGLVLGFADCGPTREPKLNGYGELYAIYLYRERQGLGLGRKLFESCLARMKERQFKNFFASVLTDNISAIGFYKKMGGFLIGHDQVDIAGQRLQTDTFSWTL